ncbi:MAG: hypothetical protein K2W82_11110 [Candidatus Obscuribacterales bacterium]|nr:hypothetical protein [Candidatus Obscuribacterales bacterium]
MSKRKILTLPISNIAAMSISRCGSYLVGCGPTSQPDSFLVQDLATRDTLSIQEAGCIRALGLREIKDGSYGMQGAECEIFYSLHNEVGLVHRLHLPSRQRKDSLVINALFVHKLTLSEDRRLLAIGAATSYSGVPCVDIRNLDGEEAFRYYSCQLPSFGSIISMCFNRCNSELFVSLDTGEIFIIDVFHGSWRPLHRDDGNHWPCYSLACQPEHSHGMVFGGEGGIIWFSNSPHKLSDNFTPQTMPFKLATGEIFTGYQYLFTEAMPEAQFSILPTRAGRFISHLKFLNKNELLVVGDRAVEIWDLVQNQRLQRREFEDNNPILAVGNTAKSILIAHAAE